MLNSELSETIQNKLYEINNALSRHVSNEPNGLIGGKLGRALFFFNYYTLTNAEESLTQAESIIEDVINNVANLYKAGMSLSTGLTGLSWILKYGIKNGFIDDDCSEFLKEIDNSTFKFATEQIKKGNYDHLHGALGVGLSYLLDVEKEESRAKVEEIIQVLQDIAIESEEFIKWNSFDMKSRQVKLNEFNLGLAHGIPGILVFLVKAYENGVAKDRVYGMSQKLIALILSCRQQNDGKGSYFPNSVGLSQKQDNSFSRLAWCYGDVGVIYSLFWASHLYGDEQLKEQSIEMMLYETTRRDLDLNSVWDAGFCHGTSGLAYIFLKLYSLTSILSFKEAAEFWYEKTIEISIWENGIAGYKSFHVNETPKWRNDTSLIEGVTGIGLALMLPKTQNNTNWDEIFLLN